MHKDSTLLSNFGLKEVERKQMVECRARILDPVNILCNKNQVIRSRDGQWRLQNRHMFMQPAELSGTWLIIWQCRNQHKSKDYNDLVQQKLRHGLVNTMKSVGIRVDKEPNVQDLSRFSVDQMFQLMQQKLQQKPQLVVFIINDENDCYNNIKSTAELKLGLITQCMRFDKLEKQMDFKVPADQVGNDRRLSAYLTNVCHKINAKLGGINTGTKIENLKS